MEVFLQKIFLSFSTENLQLQPFCKKYVSLSFLQKIFPLVSSETFYLQNYCRMYFQIFFPQKILESFLQSRKYFPFFFLQKILGVISAENIIYLEIFCKKSVNSFFLHCQWSCLSQLPGVGTSESLYQCVCLSVEAYISFGLLRFILTMRKNLVLKATIKSLHFKSCQQDCQKQGFRNPFHRWLFTNASPPHLI